MKQQAEKRDRVIENQIDVLESGDVRLTANFDGLRDVK